MKIKQFFLVVLTFISLVNISSAQDRWSFELRPAANFPTADLGSEVLKTGFGFDGMIAYRFANHLGLYAGWGWNKFASEQVLANYNPEYEETGYTLGLQFIHPLGESNVGLLVRGGGIYNHIEVEDGDEIIADSEHEIGWQIEGGLSLKLGENWRLLPSVRYRSLNNEFKSGPITTEVDLKYISAGLGISFMF